MIVLLLLLLVWIEALPAQVAYEAPDIASLRPAGSKDLREPIEWYSADRENLLRYYRVPFSLVRARALEQFEASWLDAIGRVAPESLDVHGKADLVAWRSRVAFLRRRARDEQARIEEMRPWAPFSESVAELYMARQRVESVDPEKTAGELVRLDRLLKDLTASVISKDPAAPNKPVTKTIAFRAARAVDSLRQTLKEWYGFYDGYDPLFTWWLKEPYQRLDKDMAAYAELLREKLAGVKKDDRDTIIGDPVGRDALMAELSAELIPYTPEELIAMAEKEFAWCDGEMLRASRDLGFGEDWKKALEHVKTLHAAPGKQPELVRDQVIEALDFVTRNGMITVPPQASAVWRMRMMTPERQRINPFFTGGPELSVSFPTDGMTHEQKQMSMRGNNIHFSRATVLHEVIPGHYLQMYMNRRHRPYRDAFWTPFWMEGWALYWEMILWDRGFPRTPENRIGALFWRMHRCARIVFSLKFHLGQMTPDEAIAYLVERVGHERENAAAEVRRSVASADGPLYQCAYMLGALQFRGLRREAVESGGMGEREFHDRILRLGMLPVELVRASLRNVPHTANWRFYPE
ncbi:MAG: DUF885 family protein [Bryobacteraceae bacterium]